MANKKGKRIHTKDGIIGRATIDITYTVGSGETRRTTEREKLLSLCSLAQSTGRELDGKLDYSIQEALRDVMKAVALLRRAMNETEARE